MGTWQIISAAMFGVMFLAFLVALDEPDAEEWDDADNA